MTESQGIGEERMSQAVVVRFSVRMNATSVEQAKSLCVTSTLQF